MKNSNKIKLSAIAFALLMTASCKTPQKISGEYAMQSFAVECIGTDPSGILTMRTWGNGITRAKAMEQAKRRALETVIFDGVAGAGDYNKRPLLTEVNAREKYQNYFNQFFADEANYEDLIKLEEKNTSRMKSKNSSMEQWGCIVLVDRTALQNKLISDGILKQ